MAYTALKLITKSWYLSQIVARRLQTVNGDQIADGLDLLNALLDIKLASEQRLIPYYTQYNANFVANQEMYFIPGLAIADTLTFNLDNIRYSMLPQSRKRYFGTARANNITSLPYNYRFERCKGGTNLFVYFKPQANYSFEIWGKFGLTDVTLTTDLSAVYDLFFIEYLRYALSDYMCSEYGRPFLPRSAQILASYKKELANVSPPDLSISKASNLTRTTGLNWADINIGHQWRPG